MSLLTLEQRQKLLKRHRFERNGRVKDRIKAVLHRDDGKSYAEIAEILFLSDEGVRQQIEDFIHDEKLAPANGGSEPQLDEKQTTELLEHLDTTTYLHVKQIVAHVKMTFHIDYSESGMTQWLKRNGFSYHKPAGVPAKADHDAQAAFIAYYEALKRGLKDGEKLFFMDGVHPTHQTRLVCGWIRKGVRKELPTTSGQKRMNIIGALDLEDMNLITQEYATIDGEAIVNYLKYLEAHLPTATAINVVLDCARYHTCPEVAAYVVSSSRLRLHFLPAYSPNLNVIERCWKIMHEHVTANHYYPSFNQFADAINDFLKNIFPRKARDWIDRLTDNFTPVHANS